MSTRLLKISAAKNRFLFALDPVFDFGLEKPLLESNTGAEEGQKQAAKQAKTNKSFKKLKQGIKQRLQKHYLKTSSSFQDFLNLTKAPLLKRRDFIKALLPPSDFSLLDGLVVFQKIKKGGISCHFYNKDGSKAEMCGNAACCVSLYMQWIGLPLMPFRLGQKTVHPVKGGGILLSQLKQQPIKHFQLKFKNQSLCYSFVKAGVPHGVLEIDREGESLSFKKLSLLRERARFLRFKNPESQEKGMNVTFFQVQRANSLKAITYERGVEDFTLSCGTGAISSALVWHKRKKLEGISLKQLFVEMPGGKLKISFQAKLALFSPVSKGF